MSQWYAIRSATRREKTAHDSLVEKEFATFLPLAARWSRVGAQRRRVETPVFPGYLFVVCDEGQFEQVLGLDGVHQFVRYIVDGDLTPMPIPHSQMVRLIEACGSADLDQTIPTAVAYVPKPGDRVEITGTHWIGHMAKVLAAPPGRRVEVLVDGRFGGKVTLDVAHLSAA